MECIKKVQIDDIIYTANTDFRIAIRCNEIAEDKSIGDFERSLGIICTMFGPEAIDNFKEHPEHQEKLMKWILNYLSCGEEIEKPKDKPDMDYIEDMPLIETSFMSDYGIWLSDIEMDWQKFSKLMNGLSYSELGNCCILNRIRDLRTTDLSDIKDSKTRQKVADAKRKFELKKYKKENNLTKEQEESMERLNKILGL